MGTKMNEKLDKLEGLTIGLIICIMIGLFCWCYFKSPPQPPRIRQQDAFRQINEIHEYLGLGD